MFISSSKKYQPTEQAFWCTRKLHGIVWNSGCLDYSELPNILPRDVRSEYFAKRREKFKILGNLRDKEVENMDNPDCRVFEILQKQMKKCGFAREIHSDTILHFTVQSARQNCLVTSQ